MITGISKGESQASECEIQLGRRSASLPCRSQSVDFGYNWPMTQIMTDAVSGPEKLGYRAEYKSIFPP